MGYPRVAKGVVLPVRLGEQRPQETRLNERATQQLNFPVALPFCAVLRLAAPHRAHPVPLLLRNSVEAFAPCRKVLPSPSVLDETHRTAGGGGWEARARNDLRLRRCRPGGGGAAASCIGKTNVRDVVKVLYKIA